MHIQDLVADELTRLVGEPVSATFGALLIVHMLAGVTCVVTGATALFSRKQHGSHTTYGDIYFWALAVVFVTATAMAGLRWHHSAYLFVLGCVAFGFGSLGYLARKRRWSGWFSLHMLGMSLSYIVLMTAFYVDNGPKLPIWNQLPTVTFWIAPSAIGLPLLIRSVHRRRVRVASDLRSSARAAAAAISAAWTT